ALAPRDVPRLVSARAYLQAVEERSHVLHNKAVTQKDALISSMQATPEQQAAYTARYDAHYNESLADVVRNMQEEEKIARTDAGLFQVIDPIFLLPAPSATGLGAHFYAPAKFI